MQIRGAYRMLYSFISRWRLWPRTVEYPRLCKRVERNGGEAMVGTLVKWRLSWIALVALSLFAVWGCRWVDELGNNSGQREQRLIDVVMAFNYSLPLVGFFWFRHLLKTSSDQKAKIVLWSGWGVLLVAGVALFLLYQVSPHQQTPSIGALELLRVSSNLFLLIPPGGLAKSPWRRPPTMRSLLFFT